MGLPMYKPVRISSIMAPALIQWKIRTGSSQTYTLTTSLESCSIFTFLLPFSTISDRG
ncbi:hypothetical protein D3C81_2139130 [compost metagenome]